MVRKRFGDRETQREEKRKGERGGKNRGEGPDCRYSLTPRCSCHFKKWSNIINGGLAGPDILLRLTSPRPSHHYHGPSSIKIQSLLRLVWLRRASVQIRGADPLLSVLRGGGVGGWRGVPRGSCTQSGPGQSWSCVEVVLYLWFYEPKVEKTDDNLNPWLDIHENILKISCTQ